MYKNKRININEMATLVALNDKKEERKQGTEYTKKLIIMIIIIIMDINKSI